MKNISKLVFALLLFSNFSAYAETDTNENSNEDLSSAYSTEPIKPKAFPAEKLYRYAHNEAEYSISLPEPPSVRTIWADTEVVPYLDNPPKVGSAGEIATFKRVDPDTGDSFSLEIIFIKASEDYISTLHEEKIRTILEKDFKGIHLQNKSFDYAVGENELLRRGSMKGFSVDKNNEPFYYTEQFLTATQSILVIKLQYSIENEMFSQYYHGIMDNIEYLPL